MRRWPGPLRPCTSSSQPRCNIGCGRDPIACWGLRWSRFRSLQVGGITRDAKSRHRQPTKPTQRCRSARCILRRETITMSGKEHVSELLRDLCEHGDNRHAIAKAGTIPLLVLQLENGSERAIVSAAKALSLIALRSRASPGSDARSGCAAWLKRRNGSTACIRHSRYSVEERPAARGLLPQGFVHRRP